MCIAVIDQTQDINFLVMYFWKIKAIPDSILYILICIVDDQNCFYTSFSSQQMIKAGGPTSGCPVGYV